MFKRIVVAIDGSPGSNRALKMALDLAREQRAALTAVHVIDQMTLARSLGATVYGSADYFGTIIGDLRTAGRRVLAKAERMAAGGGRSLQTVLVDSRGETVSAAILGQARKMRADLIVMGTHGRRGLGRLMMGSDAEAVLRDARVPLLIVRSRTSQGASRPAKRSARKAKRG